MPPALFEQSEQALRSVGRHADDRARRRAPAADRAGTDVPAALRRGDRRPRRLAGPAATGWRTASSTSASRWCARGSAERGLQLLDGVGQIVTENAGADGAARQGEPRDRLRAAAGGRIPRRRAPRSNACASRVRSRARRCSAPAGPTRRRSSTRPRSLPWQELQGRNLLDAAVQESYLAVPYAYAELGAMAQAVEYYESAIAAYDAERARIGESIERDPLRDGCSPPRCRRRATAARAGSRQLATLPDSPESRYLYHLLAGHEFQEGLKNYRALDSMAKQPLGLGRQPRRLRATWSRRASRPSSSSCRPPTRASRPWTSRRSTAAATCCRREFEAALAERDVYALATDAGARTARHARRRGCRARARHAGDASLRRGAREGAPRARRAAVEARRRTGRSAAGRRAGRCAT